MKTRKPIIFPKFSEIDADLRAIPWRSDSCGYARATIKNSSGVSERVFAHHIVVERQHGRRPRFSNREVVDHVDRDKLNNTRENLHITTIRVNNANIERDDGAPRITLHSCGKFQSQIAFLGKGIYLGLYKTKIEAEAASKGCLKLLQKINPRSYEFIMDGKDLA